MRLTDGGNFGIVINTPRSLLHVAGNATINGTLFVDGFNISARISGDNTTQNDLIAGNNNTLTAGLGTKVNLTASSSRQCTSGEYIGNVTTLGGLITVSKCFNQTAADDNTTQANLITGNNNTLYAQLGQKLNLTGGTLSGLLTITGNPSNVGNLSLSVNNTLYVNQSASWVGIGTANPQFNLHIKSPGEAFIYVESTNTVIAGARFITGGTTWEIGSGVGDNTANFNIFDGLVEESAITIENGTGNVGIGTTSPSAGLQINTSNPALRTNGSVFIDGNVGIGTTTPTALLTVAAANATNNHSLNISGRILFNTSTNVFNVTTGISCGMINGGTDTDFCVDATAGTSDNTTLTNLITGNNNTLLGLIGTKSNLTDITSMNNTLTAGLGTKANLTDLTNANNTIYGSLGTKANLTDLANANNTIYGSLGTKANLTDLTNANNTIYGSLGTKANLTDLTNANNTIYGSLGQK